MWRSFSLRRLRRVEARTAASAAAIVLLSSASVGAAQSRQSTATPARDAGLDSLIARAIAVDPTILAARRRIDAARARVASAGARPDPMLSAGLQNQPIGREQPAVSAHGLSAGARDPMTMRVIGVSQTIPFPGKLGLRTAAAQHDVDAAAAAADDARLRAVRDVRSAYYELAFIDRSLSIVEESRTVLADIIRVTEAHYAVGSGMQQDVLKARLAIARLADEANDLHERRSAQLASLNAVLDRPSDTPVDSAAIPQRVVLAAVPDSANSVRFAAEAFGAPAAGSPLPSLPSLQAMAIANSPMLREHEARIAAQETRLALAEKATRPDIDVSLEYGQRSGLTDMVSAMVSVPIPIQHGRKQDEDVASARFELDALEAEHRAAVNDLGARVAKLYADLDRERTQLALSARAILPQGRATVAATTASYQAGMTDLLSLLDSQSALFTYEISYYRSLTDFAASLAELEQVIGKEIRL